MRWGGLGLIKSNFVYVYFFLLNETIREIINFVISFLECVNVFARDRASHRIKLIEQQSLDQQFSFSLSSYFKHHLLIFFLLHMEHYF